MSTVNKQRAKKAVLLLLGVSSVATMGLMISQQGHVNQADDDLVLQPQNDTDKILSSPIRKEEILIDKTIENKNNYLNNNEEQQFAEAPPGNKSVSTVPTAINIKKFEKVNVVATGYTAGKESTGKDPSHPEYGITYSGVPVRRDVFSTIAADLNVFPLGTVLYIPGYGYGVVADKGSAIKGKKIDLYFETVEDVYNNWGKKRIEVYVIKRGNGMLTEKILDQYNHVAQVSNAT